MDRVVRVSPEELEHSLRLSVEDRLRQANAAFRLYHALHRPYEKPWVRGIDRIEDLPRIEEEVRRRR